MFLNEHQSKLLFQEVGITTPAGWLVGRNDVEQFVPSLPAPWFVKAQVLAGGRGKAGGIRKVDSLEMLREQANDLMSHGLLGKEVPFVRIEPEIDIAKECYLSFVISRRRKELLLTASGSGGVEIESQHPIIRSVPLKGALPEYLLRTAFFEMGVSAEHWPSFAELVYSLHRAVIDYGLLLAEINPLILDGSGRWIALDGKVEIDDNVVDIRPKLMRFYTKEHFSDEESRARDSGLSYVELHGWVGLLVNGAGLAMATMDALNRAELPPANFMDLGGAADAVRMRHALDILNENKKVCVAYINLFGGIVSCAKVANALVEAVRYAEHCKPVVIRLDGFEAEKACAILHTAALPHVYVATTTEEAFALLKRIGRVERNNSESVLHQKDVAYTEAAPFSQTQQKISPSFSSLSVSNPEGTPSQSRQQNRLQTLHAAKTPLSYVLPHQFPTYDTRVLVVGITGRMATLHTELMQQYGTQIVAGVTPFKGGQQVLGVPVYDSVHEACVAHHIDAAILFVPARAAADSLLEVMAESIPWAVCITEGIPQQEMLNVVRLAEHSATRIIGPNTPGLIVPDVCKLGIMPSNVFKAGSVALFSRSGTLTYEAAATLSRAGIGQSVCVGIGGDSFIGSDFVSMCQMVRDDDATKAVLILGEVGGTAEEELALWVQESGFPKPIVSVVAGLTAPPGRRLGHAGAILDEGAHGSESKLFALRQAGIYVRPDILSMLKTVQEVLKK